MATKGEIPAQDYIGRRETGKRTVWPKRNLRGVLIDRRDANGLTTIALGDGRFAVIPINASVDEFADLLPELRKAKPVAPAAKKPPAASADNDK
jgi:hypothetical protein